MGVPAFFRWLQEKYPRALTPVHETVDSADGGLLSTTPTGAECDNLYVDMNGIIHPCAHPEDRKQPESEEQMFEDLMCYVDRLVAATRPTRVVYLAIDGVAPRAKMNQQRARRWKAAKEAQEKRELEAETRRELCGPTIHDGPPVKRGDLAAGEWDSNVITPGTTFMHRLAQRVRFGVAQRIQRGTGHWAGLVCVVSDATVPGEGEHKIMAFVRALRAQPGYDASTRHVLHGLDADLIMLALATHEVDFSILREEVLFGRAAKQYEEQAVRSRANASALAGKGAREASPTDSWIYNKRLQLLRVSTLREYLEVEFAGCCKALVMRNSLLASTDPSCFDFDLERVLDDFVFLCFFCGNDFLPHLPSLDIREGALDMLLNVYKAALPRLGGYVASRGGRIDLRRLASVLQDIGRVEDEIFQRRRKSQEDDQQRKKRDSEWRKRQGLGPGAVDVCGDFSRGNCSRGNTCRFSHGEVCTPNSAGTTTTTTGTKQGDDASKVRTVTAPPLKGADDASISAAVQRKLKEKEVQRLDACSASLVDEVRLGEDGWKERYYGAEFKRHDIEKGGGTQVLLAEYLRGLEWVLRYYYAGCASWAWYFPFHYAPFASDLALFVRERIEQAPAGASNDTLWGELCVAKEDAPLSPLQQLMAVLPAASAHALPSTACRELMLTKDSPICDFYQDECAIDPDGKAMPWLHVVLLPFVDEKRLLAALNGVEPKNLEANEKNQALVFCRADHAAAAAVLHAANGTTTTGDHDDDDDDEKKTALVALQALIAGDLTAAPQSRRIQLGARVPKPGGGDAIERCDVANCALKDPTWSEHSSHVLPTAVHPRRVLFGADLNPRGPPRLGKRGAPNVAELGLEAHRADLAKAQQMMQAGGLSPALAALLQPKTWGSLEPTPKRQRVQPAMPPRAQPPYPSMRTQPQYPLQRAANWHLAGGAQQFARGRQPHMPPPPPHHTQPLHLQQQQHHQSRSLNHDHPLLRAAQQQQPQAPQSFSFSRPPAAAQRPPAQRAAPTHDPRHARTERRQPSNNNAGRADNSGHYGPASSSGTGMRADAAPFHAPPKAPPPGAVAPPSANIGAADSLRAQLANALRQRKK